VRAPLLGAITLHPTGGGIAVVSKLLWSVFQSRWGSDARLETMFDHESRPATLREKLRFGMAVRKAQLAGRTDWILFSHLALAEAQRFVPARLRQRYGVFLHGIEAWAPLSARVKRTLAAAEVRIANSRYTAERVMTLYPEVGPVVACPLALPPEFEASIQRDGASLDLGPRAVLVVGRMSRSERYKGHTQLIAAWPAVVARVPDAQLVIVGDGDDAPRLRQMAADSGAAKLIVFTGFVPAATLHALYERSALFALPSGAEGFGLVYLEAMTHRLACVGSVHDAASEIIADGVTGRLVNQDDIVTLAEVVAGLLIDESKRKSMGEAGRQRRLNEFGFDRFSRRLSALIGADDDGARRQVH
jgi:glycosyltransferase involved in cell wall biosynthesis